MANCICIMGDSGNGKTTSMRNLNPETTLYIDCDKKGLSWKGWKDKFNGKNKNYVKTDLQSIVLTCLNKVNEDKDYKHIKTVVIDTINGIMVADEMRRSKEKGFDKWQDLACAVYDLIDYALIMRDDVAVIFVAHTQTERDDSGYMYTRIKTSGKKLDKICLESKFTTVLLAKCVDGRYVFETQSKNSTAKSPMGMFEEQEIDNDITAVIKAVEEF